MSWCKSGQPVPSSATLPWNIFPVQTSDPDKIQMLISDLSFYNIHYTLCLIIYADLIKVTQTDIVCAKRESAYFNYIPFYSFTLCLILS